MEHHFDIEVAKEYGVVEAVFINHFQFWIAKNKANGLHQHDGRTWTYNSMKAFGELFPYLSTKSLRTVIQHLINQGVLLTGNFNETAYDRTLWYAFVDEDKWLFQNRQLHLPETANGNARNGKPIPDNIPDDNSNNSPITDSPTMNSSPINSPIITETPLSPKRGNQKLGLDLSFIAASFRPAIDIWLEYKKERKQSYKQKGLEALYHKLVNLSNGDPHTAMLIVEQSMANNYQGLFELKGGNNGNPASRPTDAQMLRAAIDQSWGPGGDPLADIL
jgi:hypothetical protein